MNIFRQGDLLLIEEEKELEKGSFRSDLILARGEKTGHTHRITSGEAMLLDSGGEIYLLVESSEAMLEHDEHHRISIPRGNYRIAFQREYNPRKGSWHAED